MKKIAIFLFAIILLFVLFGCDNSSNSFGREAINNRTETKKQKHKQKESRAEENTGSKENKDLMKIKVSDDNFSVEFKLNDSKAADQLYRQLPLSLKVENFSSNEKIFYPQSELSIEDTPLADARKGTLAYFEPWGDVVMFYKNFGEGDSLYELGEAVRGKENIEKLSGQIMVTAVETKY